MRRNACRHARPSKCRVACRGVPRAVAKRTNDNIHENNTEAISSSTITTSWGERDENNTENISGSTITTSWVVQASEHHGASAEQHTNENNTENVSGSTITTSWVVQASEHSEAESPVDVHAATGAFQAHHPLGARRALVLAALQGVCWISVPFVAD